jgi:formamidopyrimidine-DNA glycosylase
MPELPEVETVRRGLEPALEGKRLAAVTTRRRDLRTPFPPLFAERLAGRLVLSVRRRAKYLLIGLEGGETLVMHMGMSGRFTIHGTLARRPGCSHNKEPACATEAAAPRPRPGDSSGSGKHDHVVIETGEGTRIVFTDQRRFGLMTVLPTGTLEKNPLFDGLGPEPLDETFTPETLSAALKGKKTPIKAALLDQRVVAGLGNIYVCEALFRARISPKRLARSVAGVRVARLVTAIKAVLNEAIAAGGSSLRDYAHTDGELGYFQHRFAVYDREGMPCAGKDCAGTVKRIVQSGRSSFYCPSCQR